MELNGLESTATAAEKRRASKVFWRLGLSALMATTSVLFIAGKNVSESERDAAPTLGNINPDHLTRFDEALQPNLETTTTTAPQLTQEQWWELQAAAANADGRYDRLANCETRGNWHMKGNRYSGGVGFYNPTWTQFHLPGMPANAGDATKAQQIVVAERVVHELQPYGSWRGGKWGCAPVAGLP